MFRFPVTLALLPLEAFLALLGVLLELSLVPARILESAVAAVALALLVLLVLELESDISLTYLMAYN